MSGYKNYYHVLRDEASRIEVLQWWARLQNDENTLKQVNGTPHIHALPRSVRAELRRSHSVDDALLTEGFRLLWTSLGEPLKKSAWRMLAWATVAAVLADVRENNDLSFAVALGTQKEQTGRPYVSELRFAQLQKSDSPDAFLRRSRRAVALIGRRVSVLSLADSILHWHQEKNGEADERPEYRLAVRWATDYFTALAAYQK